MEYKNYIDIVYTSSQALIKKLLQNEKKLL